MVGDIDFFTYPKKYLESVIEDQSDLQRIINKQEFIKAKKYMREALLKYVRCYE